MANQPTPIRPWFRLASIRAPPPAPAPIAEPRSSITRPTFRALAPISTQPLPPAIAPPSPARPASRPPLETPAAVPLPAPAVTQAPSVDTAGNAGSVPSSPVARVSAPSASLPTSPVPRAVRTLTNSVPTSPAPEPAAQDNGRAKQPLKPTNDDETSPHSPKVKLTARPPSPLTLPPSQLKSKEESDKPTIPGEPEPKTVLVQKNIQKPKSSYNGNGEFRNSGEARNYEHVHDGKQEAAKKVETKDGGSTHRKVSVSEDGGPRVIILAGENKGAVMDLIQSSSKKHGTVTVPSRLHEKGNPSIKNTGGRQWDTYSSSNEDENVNRKDKNHEGKTKASSPLIAYMNSNVQGVNNSIMYHSKCHHKDPGVHLVLSRKLFSEEFQHKKRVPDHHD